MWKQALAAMRLPRRSTAAATPAGGEPPPASPEERLQSAFFRIARADHIRRWRLENPKELLEVMDAGIAEEKKGFALEKRRRQVFDRIAVPGDPCGEEHTHRNRPQASDWQGLLHQLSGLFDEADTDPSDRFGGTRFALTEEEGKCAYALAKLLTELVRSGGPSADSPAAAAALARLEEIATVFAAFDARQAEVLADPDLGAAEQQAQLAEWAARQDQYAERLFADAAA